MKVKHQRLQNKIVLSLRHIVVWHNHLVQVYARNDAVRQLEEHSLVLRRTAPLAPKIINFTISNPSPFFGDKETSCLSWPKKRTI